MCPKNGTKPLYFAMIAFSLWNAGKQSLTLGAGKWKIEKNTSYWEE